MNRVVSRLRSVLALVLVLGGIPSTSRSQDVDTSDDYTNLSKPLDRFTMEDLIFKRPSSESEVALYEDWIQASVELSTRATYRGESARRAIDLKRQEIETLKVHKKQAEADKDPSLTEQVKATIHSEEQAVKILERISKMSILEQRTAESWRVWCQAMKKVAEAAVTVEAYRTARFADAPQGGVPSGLVLEPRALSVYRDLTAAYEDAAQAHERLGSDLKKLMKEQKKLLQDLERGGLVAAKPS